MEVNITHIDTACILIEINGYRILTDPTFDGGGDFYYHGFGAVSKKTGFPAMDPADLGRVDLVLLSHHQHHDNLDFKGRDFVLGHDQVLSTKSAAKEMQHIIGLSNWQTYAVDTELLGNLRITAVPAQHRPWWIPEFISGKVIGFVIEFEQQQNGVIYISGDTVYFDGIPKVAKRFNVDIGIFHAGSVQFRYLTGLGMYTMDGRQLLRAARDIMPRVILPIHRNGWTHFKEKETDLQRILASDPVISARTIFLAPGLRTTF